MSDDKVVITPPVLFGRGYVFDRTRRTVSISRRLMGIPISKTQAPFFQITSLRVNRVYVEGTKAHFSDPSLTGYVPETSGGWSYVLTMRVGGKEFKIWRGWQEKGRGRVERIEVAIRGVIWSR